MNPSAWFIRGMEKVGLDTNVVRIAHERQQQKLAGSDQDREHLVTAA